MILDPETVENFVIDQLKGVLDIPVEPYPDVQSIEEYRNAVASAMGAVVVVIPRMPKGESHEAGSVFGFHVQFHIYLSSFRSKSGHVGVYDVIVDIVNTLDEKRFKIDDHPCNTVITDAYYTNRSDDLYHYTVDMEVRPKFFRLA